MPYDAARRELGAGLARHYWELTERALRGWRRWPATPSCIRAACGSPATSASEMSCGPSTRRWSRTASPPSGSTICRRRSTGCSAVRSCTRGDGSLRPARWVRRLAALAAEAAPSCASTSASSRSRRSVTRRSSSRRTATPAARPVPRRAAFAADARPGARHGAARSHALPAPALLALRVRLLAAAAGRPPGDRRSARHEPRDRVHRGRGDDAADPGGSRLLDRRRRPRHAPLGGILGSRRTGARSRPRAGADRLGRRRVLGARQRDRPGRRSGSRDPRRRPSWRCSPARLAAVGRRRSKSEVVGPLCRTGEPPRRIGCLSSASASRPDPSMTRSRQSPRRVGDAPPLGLELQCSRPPIPAERLHRRPTAERRGGWQAAPQAVLCPRALRSGDGRSASVSTPASSPAS